MRPVRHFTPRCAAGLQYADRRRLCGTHAGPWHLCAQPDTRGRFLNKQLSFAAEMGVLNLEHRTEVLRAEWVSYTPELFARLKLERGDRCYHLVRMRYVSGKPLFSWKLCAGIRVSRH